MLLGCKITCSAGIALSVGLALLVVPAPCETPTSAAQPAKSKRTDWPTFGGSPSRNMVNLIDKNVPISWRVEDGKFWNIKWFAKLGTHTYSSPVIANGRIYIGTNNRRPRNPMIKGPKAVLMCFRERDGRFLWQRLHKMPPEKIVNEALNSGMCSTPTVEGNRIYYLAPASELVSADTKTGIAVWTLEMMKTLDVHPCYLAMNSPIIVGDLLFVQTCNGVNPRTGKLPKPGAPSFVAVNKRTGKIVWQSKLPGKGIIEGQWSNPAYAKVNGIEQVIFAGGDCWLYGLEPKTGKLLWKFHCNLKQEIVAAKKRGMPNYIISSPVVYQDKVYIGLGMHPEHPVGNKIGHFWCVDLVKALKFGKPNPGRDVSLKKNNLDPKAAVNKTSALAWHFGGLKNPRPKFGRTVHFGRTLSTAAIHDGLVYISEEYGYMHCLDAKTGKKRYWTYDFRTGIWGSPYWVDGKIYIGTDDGDVFIFAHGKKRKLITPEHTKIVVTKGQRKKVIFVDPVYMEGPIITSPVVANGTLYIMTKSKLYAIGR